jgi:hypothetical protein
VGVVQRLGHLAPKLQRGGKVEPTLPGKPLAQRPALDEGHDVVEGAIGLSRVVERQEIGVVQLGCYPDLPEKPLPSQNLGQAEVEHLERNVPVVLEVACEIDHGHAAVADLALDGVTILQNRREVILELRQTDFRKGSPLRYHRASSPASSPTQAFIAAAITPGTRVQLAFSSNAVIRRIRTWALR